MLEVGHWVVGEIRPQHVSDCLRVEQAAGWDQGTQLGGGGGLAAAKGPVQPDDHLVTNCSVRPLGGPVPVWRVIGDGAWRVRR